jgi:hypothetical protein
MSGLSALVAFTPEERHLLGRIARNASVGEWQLTGTEADTALSLLSCGIIERHTHPKVPFANYTLSAEGGALMKRARVECKACPNWIACR